jgi:hypothetical protein
MTYTMNISEEFSVERGYEKMFKTTEVLKMAFGHSETFCAYDAYGTCQMADFSKVVMEYMDPAHKLSRHEAFPQECKRAFEFGNRLMAAE